MIDLTQIKPHDAPVAVETAPAKLVKVDLACGQVKEDGWTGVDFVAAPGVDIVHDLFTFPWPFEDQSVDEIKCSHFFEHVPGPLRGKFMDEVWRILKNDGKALFITPFWSSERSVQDFTHAWPPICVASYLYFNRGWREANKLTHGHYDLKCNFDMGPPATAIDSALVVRSEEYRAFAGKHYLNAVYDIHIQLIRKP